MRGVAWSNNRGDCLRITLYVSHFLRLVSSNTPHPSWRFAPIHLLPQGEKGETRTSPLPRPLSRLAIVGKVGKTGGQESAARIRKTRTGTPMPARPVSVAPVDRSRAPLHVLSMDNDARMIRLPFTKHWRFARNAGPLDALGAMGSDPTGRGHRRPTDPQSGTGSRKGDAEDYAGGAGCVNKSG